MYCDIAVSRKREPSARICQWQIDERRQQCCRVLVTIPLPTKKREHFALHLFCRIAILPFPVSGNPRQEFANGKLTNDGNSVAAYSSRYPCQQKRESILLSLFCWQGRRDSNTQPTVLETATLPLSHSPIKPVHFTIIQNESQEFLIVF